MIAILGYCCDARKSLAGGLAPKEQDKIRYVDDTGSSTLA